MLKRLLPATAALLALSTLAACGNEADNDEAVDSSTGASTPADSPTQEESAAAGTTCDYPEDGSPAAKPVEPPPAEATATGTLDGTISTNAGDIAIKLDADRTPCTVNSFTSLAEQGYFDDTQCHRVTTQGIYVLQCGDPSATGMGGPGYTIPDEVDGSEKYGPGVLAMANTGDPDTGGLAVLPGVRRLVGPAALATPSSAPSTRPASSSSRGSPPRAPPRRSRRCAQGRGHHLRRDRRLSGALRPGRR